MVRTMAEMLEDPARIRVTVDVEVSPVGTAAQANRIQVLESELAEERRRRAADLALVERQRDEALAQVKEYDRDRHTERDRADETKRELERRTQERDERERARARLEAKLDATVGVLRTPSVVAALERLEDSEADYVHSLAWAVKNALVTLDRL